MANFTKIVFTCIFLLSVVGATAQNNFFSDKPEKIFKQSEIKATEKASKYRTIFLDTIAFKNFLKTVPFESANLNRENTPVLELPMPNGNTAKFHIWESMTMAPELAAKFPEIKTYSGQGIDDKTATIKIDWTPLGFHAMILSAATTGSIFIDPYSNGNLTNYISYFKNDYKKKAAFKEVLQEELQRNIGSRPIAGNTILGSAGTQLRTYRLALACTHQYAVAVCSPSSPTVGLTLSAIITAVNRINQIYEKELAIHLNLIANENSIIFPTVGVDPFTANDDALTLVDQSQSVITNTIGSANFDIGHTFSTGAGGNAEISCVCKDDTKARAATGTPAPFGDPFVIDYVCHEMGHQFGANHSFNSNLDLCGAPGQWTSTTNAEPGSGSTIMCYAADATMGMELCSTDNLQNSSDAYFHTIGFNQITTYTLTGTGSTCGTSASTGNIIPIVAAGADYTIPKSTPFILTGTATDGNNDALTYCWEQIDVGAPPSTWNNPSGIHAPLFRSFLPVSSGTRYFPKLSDVVNNTTTKGELLPSIARPMNFRLTARDNRSGGGGVNSDDILVTVTNDGPFTVTYPTATSITWTGNTSQTVTWNVANTTASPISTNNVTIQLSTDGGFTYPTTLIASTPNDGSETITVPNISTTTARIRVMAVGNIFYDISNNNFSILFVTPVTWVNFSAQKTNAAVSNLLWTVNEINASSYEIERSSDGNNFTVIATINANNYTNTLQQYSFDDKTPLAGINYYRIKQTDKNGNISYSTITSVQYDQIQSAWSVYPNPTTENIFVSSNVNVGKIEIKVFDATGKLVVNIPCNKVIAGIAIPVKLGNLAKGVYIVKIVEQNAIKINKVIVQ